MELFIILFLTAVLIGWGVGIIVLANINIKHFMFKHLLRAKYIVSGKFFWRYAYAVEACEDEFSKSYVWSIDYRPLYVNNHYKATLHPDANNFSTNI